MPAPEHLRNIEDGFIDGIPLLLESVQTYQQSSSMLYDQIPKGTIPDGHGHEFTVPRYGRMKANFGRKAWAPDLADPENCWDKCNPLAEKLTIGTGKETYHGYRRALESLDICLETVRKTHGFMEHMQAFENGFRAVTRTVIDDFIQDEMILRAGRTLVFLNKGAATGTNGWLLNDDLNLPGVPRVALEDIGCLSYKSLQSLQPRMDHDGWYHAATQYGGGGFPIYPLMIGLEEAVASVDRDPNWRDAHIIGQLAPSEVLKGYGVNRTVYNYAQVGLSRPPRWSPKPGAVYLDLENDRVDPEIENPDSLEIGVDYKYNPAYDEAPFEAAFMIIPSRVFELQTPTSKTSVGGKTSFAPLDYQGGMNWLNIQDRETNPLQTKGYYRADLAMAIKPKDRFFLCMMVFRRNREDYRISSEFGNFGKASEQPLFPYVCDMTLCPDGDIAVKEMGVLSGTEDIYRAVFSKAIPEATVGTQVTIFGSAGYEGQFTINGLPVVKKSDFVAKVLPQYILQANDPDNLPADCEVITCVRITPPTRSCTYRTCIATADLSVGCDASGLQAPVTGLWFAAEGATSLSILELDAESYSLPDDVAALQSDIQAALDTEFGDEVATVTVESNETAGYVTVVIADAPAGAFDLQFGSAPATKKAFRRYCEETDPARLCSHSLCAETVAALVGKRNRVVKLFSGGPYEAGDHAALQSALNAWLLEVGVSGSAVVATASSKLHVTLVDVAAPIEALGIKEADGDVVAFAVHCLGSEPAPMTGPDECADGSCDTLGSAPVTEY
jgi:hypothetical protein